MAGESRKTVTVVFTDVTGSTSLGEQLDPEALRGVMGRYFETAQTVLERHGGTVEKFIGDAVMAVFGIPQLHEDDALRAVRAAAELRERLAALNEELERERGVRIALRTGVNTGEVVAGDPAGGQFYATGDAVNVAARLEQTADPGEILVADTTYRLVRDAVDVEAIEKLDLKGKADMVHAWRLLAVREGAPAFARRFDSPLVGRRTELELATDLFERAVSDRSCRLVTVVGDAGVGKSRLAGEVLADLGERAEVVVGRCLPYGEGITFWPLVEIVRQLEERAPLAELLAPAPDGGAIAERVGEAVGAADASGSSEETFWAVRKLFEALARERPLVVVVDDIHWAEPTLLDLVEHVVDWTQEAPILFLCLARPEILEKRPEWAVARPNAVLIYLEPLSRAESERLIATIGGETKVAGPRRAQIAETAEGNPLFVEQMVAMLAEYGHEAEPVLPPTIQALLAARIDRLTGNERAVIERAAVIGREFWREALVELAPEGTPVSVALQRLVRKEFIRPERSSVFLEDAFRFRHVLIRDAAYAGISKEQRAEIHQRVAGWLEQTLPEYDEILGYHLEQAFRYRAELGPVGEDEAALARRATERLQVAGHRAFARGDVRAAANLLGRAVDLASAVGSPPIDALVELGSALADGGELSRADAVLSEAIEHARKGDDRRGELLATIEREIVRWSTTPAYDPAGYLDFIEQAVGAAEELGDDLVLAKAWRLLGDVRNVALRCDEWATAVRRALAHAERAGHEREADEDLIFLASAAYNGPTPANEAVSLCEAMLERASRRARAGILTCLAGLLAMLGEFDRARASYAEAEEILEDLGFRTRLAGRTMIYGDIELLAGDLAAGEEKMRWGCAVLERMGETGRLSTLAARLAEVVYRQGRYEEADRFGKMSEQAATANDVASQAGWRSVRAKIAARRGDLERAEELAREAVVLMESTDALDMHASAFMDLAEVLRIAGRIDEAAAAAKRAIELFDAKRNLVAAQRARLALSELRLATA
jgi:class 3 adenylate cyclase/tetratricopeptide (TPR) repeat protein